MRLGGTLRVEFVKNARLTLFHFEFCLCVFDVSTVDSSLVDCCIEKLIKVRLRLGFCNININLSFKIFVDRKFSVHFPVLRRVSTGSVRT